MASNFFLAIFRPAIEEGEGHGRARKGVEEEESPKPCIDEGEAVAMGEETGDRGKGCGEVP